MTRSDLLSYLSDPKQLSLSTLEPMRQLQLAYPYCSSFAFLYLYNLACTQDVRYPAELRRLAPLLHDGALLARLVEGLSIPSPAPSEVPPPETNEGFDLIDHFLDGARASGEDLPDTLHLGGASESSDYFSAEELAQVDPAPFAPPTPRPTPPAPSERPAPPPAPSVGEAPPENLLSETLSKIYIQQGHYDKALRIIRSLSLNYPDKSRFFVDQIRFLERLIEYNKSTK